MVFNYLKSHFKQAISLDGEVQETKSDKGPGVTYDRASILLRPGNLKWGPDNTFLFRNLLGVGYQNQLVHSVLYMSIFVTRRSLALKFEK